jgi:hypothetical protein
VGLSSGASGVIGGKIYIAGGIATSIGAISTRTLIFNNETNTWEGAAPMLTPRFGIGGAVIDGKMYVPAGIRSEILTMDASLADAAAASASVSFVPVGNLEVFTP